MNPNLMCSSRLKTTLYQGIFITKMFTWLNVCYGMLSCAIIRGTPPSITAIAYET